MSKRGLSFEEKKTRLLAYMHEHREVYTLKELEDKASKAKGIVSNTVKEVLTHLQSDGLVDTDKIGAGNFFWALPSKAKGQATAKRARAAADLESAEAAHAELEEKLAVAQAARPTSTKRAADLKRLQLLKTQASELQAEVAKFADSDPDRLKQLEKGTEICKNAANRWTDNLTTLIANVRENRPDMQESEILESLGLPKVLEYV